MDGMVAKTLTLIAVTLVPWIELRGSIPLGLAWGMPWYLVSGFAVLANVLVFIPVYFLLHLFYERWFSRVALVRRWVERVRVKGREPVEKYGVWGLAVFVAIPLPGTGAYSGTLLAFLMGMPAGRAFLAVGSGVVGAGVLVTLAATGVLAGLRAIVPGV